MPYLEAVMKINFTEPPVALLDRPLEIERARLDVQEAEKLPRIIDSDVHYAGNLVLNNPEIIIPHPSE
jgi:7,8-dihydro-6-hydroxymethylpterin-pyrophosphokinase